MRMHHIGYVVKNIDRAIAQFECLNYKIISKKIVDPIQNVNIQFVKNGHSLIEFIEPNDETSPVYNLLKKNGPMPYHLCFEVDNLEAEIKKMKESGWGVISDVVPAPAIGDNRIVFLMNRWGGLIELVEIEVGEFENSFD